MRMNIKNIKIIAETAFTHEGDISYLKKQIDVASELKLQYVKFQILLNLDSVYSKDAPIYHDLKPKLFDKENWITIFNYALQKKLRIIALPIDYDAFDFILDSQQLITAIEVHSICMNDIFVLDKLNKKFLQKLIILGIGGRTLKDIDFAIDYLMNNNILLMFGFQSFPTQKKDANIGKIKSLKEHFTYPIGFADHTPWNQPDADIIEMAVLFGSEYIEKHIIIQSGDDRADNYSAIDKKGFFGLKSLLNDIIAIYGDDDLNTLNEKELVYKERERIIVAKSDLSENETLTLDNVTYSVTEQKSDLEQKQLLEIIGKRVSKRIKKGEVIVSDILK